MFSMNLLYKVLKKGCYVNDIQFFFYVESTLSFPTTTATTTTTTITLFFNTVIFSSFDHTHKFIFSLL